MRRRTDRSTAAAASALLCACVTLGAPGLARAETSVEPEAAAAAPAGPSAPSAPSAPSEAPKHALPASNDFGRVGVELGGRAMIVPSRGFDPYAGSDAFGQFALRASYVPATWGRYSLALDLEWNYGKHGSSARGDTSELGAHRLALGLRGRAAVAERVLFFAHVAPGALYLRGTLDDGAIDSSRSLVSEAWTFALDTTAGAELLLGSIRGDHRKPAAWFWVTGELGYSFAVATTMRFAPAADSTDPRHFGAVTLPPLQLGGAVGRLAVGVSF